MIYFARSLTFPSSWWDLGVPLPQLLPSIATQPGTHPPRILGTKISFQPPTPTPGTSQELTTCPQRHPNSCKGLLPGSVPELIRQTLTALTSWMLEGYSGKGGLCFCAWGSPTCLASILPAADARSRGQPRLGVCHFLGDVD